MRLFTRDYGSSINILSILETKKEEQIFEARCQQRHRHHYM
jgi:hypothetical protein